MTVTGGPSPLQPLDPSMTAVLDLIPDTALDAGSVAEIRELMVAMMPPTPLDGLAVREAVIDESTGVTVRIFSDGSDATGRPCVYSIHGGGYVIGDRCMDDSRLATWVRLLGCVTVSVEYRLAPEHPFPAAIEDCYGGLCWVHEHADELGIDPDRIGVSGVSAGGGLTASLALLARDRGDVAVAFQLLDCPMLDDRQVTPSSQTEGLRLWSTESNEFGWRSYLGELYGTDRIPSHAAPARATDLSGLPPAIVVVGTVDGFRDEDIEYATRLNQAGVPTELHVYPGAPHGFSLFGDAAAAKQGAEDLVRWLGRQFAGEL